MSLRISCIFLVVIICIANNIKCKEVPPTKEETINCGIIALWYCARLEGIDSSPDKIKALFKPEKKELSLYNLYQAAHELGLSAMGVRMKWEELLELKSPAIAWVNKDHFVVVERAAGKNILVVDYPKPAKLYTREEFEKIWSGELLIINNFAAEGSVGKRR